MGGEDVHSVEKVGTKINTKPMANKAKAEIPCQLSLSRDRDRDRDRVEGDLSRRSGDRGMGDDIAHGCRGVG